MAQTAALLQAKSVVQLSVDGQKQSAVLIGRDRVLTAYLGQKGDSLVDWQRAERSQIHLDGDQFTLDPRACLISNRRAGWSIIGTEPVPLEPMPLPTAEPWPVEVGEQLHVVGCSSTWAADVVASGSDVVRCRSAASLPADALGGAVFSAQCMEWVGLVTGLSADGVIEVVPLSSLLLRLRKRDQWREASGSVSVMAEHPRGTQTAAVTRAGARLDGTPQRASAVLQSPVAMATYLLVLLAVAAMWYHTAVT